VILNPAPARPLPAKLLRHVYLLTPNETEAELLTGIAVRDAATADRAADRLLQQGVKNVIVTLGARGSWLAGEDGRRLVPAFKVKPVDTTAAGDVFNGALAVALAEGKPLAAAARFASAAAAISVTRLGAQTSAPTRKEILALAGARKGRGGLA
jgi:ribokinase